MKVIRRTALHLMTLTAIAYAGSTLAAGDAGHGRELFTAQCSAYHTTNGSPLVGPSLLGVVGRHAGSLAGINYTQALKSYDVVWDAASLDTFLTSPFAAVPGTTMPFSIPSASDRADVIAYLQTLSTGQ
ncbi:c-type cytochrome [Pokkaliibacter plantistimulans]|nr:c-type cytochrome [Pokkaliibacter plantistimulans]